MAAALGDLGFGQFIFVVLIAAGLSMIVFRHASRNGSKHPTAWGVAVFLAAGLFVPLYFLQYFLTRRR